MRLTPTIVIALAGAGAAAAPASAESWEFTFSRQTLTPEQPSATVTLWAKFAPTDWAFAAANLSVLSSEAGWSDLSVLRPVPGQHPGSIEPGGTTISGITVANLGTFGSEPDPSNPLAVWQATFTAADFAEREITIATLTGRYEVYPDHMGSLPEPRTPIDIEAAIRVIPAPAPLAVLALAGLAIGRRRRIS